MQQSTGDEPGEHEQMNADGVEPLARHEAGQQEENNQEAGDSSEQAARRKLLRKRLDQVPVEREKSKGAEEFRNKFKSVMCMEDNVEEMEKFMANYEHPRFVWLDLLLSSPSKNKSGTQPIDSAFVSLTWNYLILNFPDVIQRQLFLDGIDYVDAEKDEFEPDWVINDRLGALHGAVLCGLPEIVPLLSEHRTNANLVGTGICRRLKKYRNDPKGAWSFGDCFESIKRALLWCFLPNPTAYKQAERFLKCFEGAIGKDPDEASPLKTQPKRFKMVDKESPLSFIETSGCSTPAIENFLWTVVLAWACASGRSDIIQSFNLWKPDRLTDLTNMKAWSRYHHSYSPGPTKWVAGEVLHNCASSDTPEERSATLQKIIVIVEQVIKDVHDQNIPEIAHSEHFWQVCSVYNLSCRVPASYLCPEITDEIIRNSGWTAVHLAAALGDHAVLDDLTISYDLVSKTFPEGWVIEFKGKSSQKTIETVLRDSLRDTFKMTPLHHAVLGNHPLVVNRLMKWAFFNFHVNDFDIFKRTALQMACSDSDSESDKVPVLLELLKSKQLVVNTEDCCAFTPLHWAVFVGATEMVRSLLSPEAKSKGIRMLAQSADGQHPHKLAEALSQERKRDMQDLLESVPEVKDRVERLYRDRQVYVDAANAILVGAAVIASVTFGGWLQLPLGDGHESTHTKLRIFWTFNSLSFFCAIGTVIAGAEAVLPQANVYIEDSVESLRRWLVFTAFMFVCSIICVLGAFAAAGFSSLTLVQDLYGNMATTTSIGSAVCGSLAVSFCLRLLGIRRRHHKEDMVHTILMRGISKFLPRGGCFAQSKESKSGHSRPCLMLVRKHLQKPADEHSANGKLREKLGVRRHTTMLGDQFCHIRRCYLKLALQSKVSDEWYNDHFLPANTKMWKEILQQLGEIYGRAATVQSKHLLFENESGGLTRPYGTNAELERYGVKEVERKVFYLVRERLETQNQQAHEDLAQDYEVAGTVELSQLSRRKTEVSRLRPELQTAEILPDVNSPPGIRQVSRSWWSKLRTRHEPDMNPISCIPQAAGTVDLALSFTTKLQACLQAHRPPGITQMSRLWPKLRTSGIRPNVDPPPDIRQLNDSVWEFYSPQGIPKMEIIFFHGLQPDDFQNAFWKTWTVRSPPNETQIIWPRDWIPQDFPDARILSVSATGAIDAYLAAEMLVSDIILDRMCNIGQNCPVYLVGHCLGGILLKQFILSAIIQRALMDPGRDTGTISRIMCFLNNFAGVFYFATPHSFSRTGDLASSLPSRSPILELLKTIDKERARISEEFRMQRRLVRTAAVAEGLDTKCGRFIGRVVPEASARFDVDNYYTIMDSGHFTVCKPGTKQSRSYTMLTQFLSEAISTRS